MTKRKPLPIQKILGEEQLGRLSAQKQLDIWNVIHGTSDADHAASLGRSHAAISKLRAGTLTSRPLLEELEQRTGIAPAAWVRGW